MKYEVLRDFGVDVAGKHYAHGAVIDDEKLSAPELPKELSEEGTKKAQEAFAAKQKSDIAAHSKEGLIAVPAAPKTTTTGAGDAAAKGGN